jgi:hypothetical protein
MRVPAQEQDVLTYRDKRVFFLLWAEFHVTVSSWANAASQGIWKDMVVVSFEISCNLFERSEESYEKLP